MPESVYASPRLHASGSSFWCAGRDGEPAHCLLLYRFADVMRLAAIGNQEYDWEVRVLWLCYLHAWP
jgi:hypothetical protein